MRFRCALPSLELNTSEASDFGSYVCILRTMNVIIAPLSSTTESLSPLRSMFNLSNAVGMLFFHPEWPAMTALPISPGRMPRLYQPASAGSFGASIAPSSVSPRGPTIASTLIFGIVMRTGISTSLDDSEFAVAIGTGPTWLAVETSARKHCVESEFAVFSSPEVRTIHDGPASRLNGNAELNRGTAVCISSVDAGDTEIFWCTGCLMTILRNGLCVEFSTTFFFRVELDRFTLWQYGIVSDSVQVLLEI